MKTQKILPVVFFIICISSFIFAAHVITTSDGATSLIVNEDVGFIYNLTINNTDTTLAGNITNVNITFSSSLFSFITDSNGTDAGTHTFTNTSTILTWANDGLVLNLTKHYFWFNATVATPGYYNLTITTTNETQSVSTNISVYINDTNYPLVSITNPLTGGNYSGSFILNATITDDTTSLVYFNITNSSGGQNGTFTASNTAGSSWNVTINTSTYIDGLYNITVYANDSNNQLNSSILVYKVRFDNTAPTNTNFYCTPNSVYTDAIVTCYCEGVADAGVGVSSTVFTSSPSTTTAGTFTQTCTITDILGNSYAPTTTYTVNNRPSGGSLSGTTTQTWSMTYTATENQFQAGYTKSIKAKERVKLKIGNEDHFVGVKSVTVTSATIEIASDPIEITLDIGEDAKADVNDDGIYDIYVLLNNIVDNKADITITKIAEEIPEGEESITTTGEIVTPEETPAESERNYNWVWIVVIILVLIAIGVGYKVKKK